ncbi:type II secretion system protein GspL [Salinivibrio kushneri]|uniref:Type II secretion system protein L n=1 Tax=Salinivibrio kushneri TaxID=1908198 RepID=A0AB36KAJ7_9GAMM|nr:type II secretion system protein GspL [Salinivibrio kushneri]OOE45245.1 type II secretion system protein GspL [Salinivibrio kushneri]OOE46742.1 type II secretion system protein GspL [Salinivibrio kushneri]OOE67415.1 type II secretion system protein GspL [Salinivibrio kushneri]
MSERLIIRISDASQPVYWAQVRASDNQVVDSGCCQQLSALTEQAQTRPVVVLVDSTWLTLTSVTLPPGSRRQRDKVVPYLLEEALAEEVEAVHVSIVDTQADTAQVAVVAHQQMQAWQQALDEAGISARQWIPDVLCIPWQPESLSLLALGEQWLCRLGANQGVVGSADWLTFWGQTWWRQQQAQADSNTPEQTRALSIDAYGESDRQASNPFHALPFQSEWHTEAALHVLATHSHSVTANILTGDYRPQSQTKQTLKPFLPAACLLVAIAGLLGVEQWLAIRDTQQQAQALRTQSEALFRQTLPQYERIPTRSYMVRQMDAEIARLENQQHDAALLPWLAQLAPLLTEVPGIELQALRYQASRDALILRATGNDFAQFERLRAALSEHYATDLGQLNRSGETVSGEFTLRSQS